MDYYMLVRKGLVQRMYVEFRGERVKAWPVVESVRDGKRLAKFMNRKDVRPARIGSVEGEDLAGHIEMAINEDCRLTCCVSGWNEDGSPEWKFIPFD